MSKIIMINKGLEEQIPDNSQIKDICEEKFGVLFGCKDGLCGTCRIKVVEGNKNLSEKNQKEKDFFPDNESERLACQCIIKKGTVKIDDTYP